MAFEKIGWITGISLALAGCATAAPTPAPPASDGLGAAHWVETQPSVRTLLVAPRPVGEVARPGEDGARLAIGSFFARYDSPDGPVDQLALMVVLEGASAARVLASGRSLLLEIDGEFFQGDPGLGSENVHWDPADGGRATLAIPVSPEILRALSSAQLVRGRIGAYGSFDFPDRSRAGLSDLLNGLPADYRGSTSAVGVRAVVTSM
jgi:hypothetical protein